ncbi:ATP-binding protein [Thermodesulfobacteriota bacterium B35]
MSARNRLSSVISLLVFLALGLVIIRVTGNWTRSLELQRIRNKAVKALKVYTGDLESELDKFEALPQILADNPLFVDLLQHPADTARQDRVNRELERINRLAETSAIYIITPQGRVITSSNWRGAVSFVGEDLSFRPYFQQAMQGRPGRYFALGTTSHVRGYYFSSPISTAAGIIGILTVKVQLQRLEDIWARGSERVIVTDPQGVIFITSYAPWKFRALHPLSPQVTRKLRESRRYGDIEPDPLAGTAISRTGEDSAILDLRPDAVPGPAARTSAHHPYLILSRPMPDAGWTVHILSDLSHVDTYVLNSMLLAGIFLVSLVLSGMLLYNRRKARQERILLEQRSRQMLKEANEQLEIKVRQRTRELTMINRRLQEEIEEHKRTEQELRATQDELVQAGKLAAIGQMAAGITHEISQPLSAIRIYAENACIFLDQDQPEETRANLVDITQVIGKMSEITSHLKTFARKSHDPPRPVPLAGPVNSALTLLGLRLRKHTIHLTVDIADDNLQVVADPIRLEQVLVNVIGNAIDAVTGKEKREISIRAATDSGKDVVRITVVDSGPGIDHNHLERLFDPFFTTKEEGKGLGLGLSLSRAIIREFGGSIRAENHPGGGTAMHIELRAAGLEQEL